MRGTLTTFLCLWPVLPVGVGWWWLCNAWVRGSAGFVVGLLRNASFAFLMQKPKTTKNLCLACFRSFGVFGVFWGFKKPT